MARIHCHYFDCAFLDDAYCSAAAVEIDPDKGCLTYHPSENLVEEEEVWESEEELEEDVDSWEDLEDDLEDEDEDENWIDEE